MILRISVAIFMVILSENVFSLPRHKRQATPPPRETPSPEMMEILNDFQPQGSSRCPENFLLCRDGSFCFNDEQLCGGADVCPDSSDDINAICPRSITPRQNHVTASSSLSSTNNSPPTSSLKDLARTPATGSISSSTDSNWPSYEIYGRPLVIAFIVLVGGLFIYVALATYCCVTNRWNVINPSNSSS